MFVVAIPCSAFFLVNFNNAMMIPPRPFIQASVGLSAPQVGWLLAAFPITALIGDLVLVPAVRRGGLNSILNAIYQSGSTAGALASASACSVRPDFMADPVAATALFAVSGTSLWQITRRIDDRPSSERG
jgi:hypothetical protein